MSAQPEFLKLVADIIQSEMDLADDQVIFMDEKFNLPPDDRLYLSLALMGAKDFGAKTEYDPDPASGELVETLVVNRQEMHSITLLSRTREAAQRNWEVTAALNSTLSQQTQEKYSFKIGNLPTSMNKVPDEDGTARLAMYVTTFLILGALKKAKPVDYFDQFSQPLVHTNP